MNSSDIPSTSSESDPEKVRPSLDTLLSNLPGMVYRCRNAPTRPMEFVSERAEDLTGYPAHALLGNGATRYTSQIRPDDINTLQHEVSVALTERCSFQLTYRIITANGVQKWVGEWSGEIMQRRKDGSLLPVETHCTLVVDDKGKPKSVLSINTDITQRKAAETKIQHLAFYDPLTRLPNRVYLLDRLQHALANSSRSRHTGTLMFIDLDNFKTLNDTLGHDKGDLLLRQVAERLTSSMREGDTVACLGATSSSSCWKN